MKLRWKRVDYWDLSSQFQVLWKATTPQREYLIARIGRADHPRWEVFIRHADGTEESYLNTGLLRDAKGAAQRAHDRIGG